MHLRLLLAAWVLCALHGSLAAEEADKRLPVPDGKAQAASEQKLKELFKDEYAKRTPADKLAFARKLYEVGKQPSDEAVDRFVILREAGAMASQGGDAALALKVIDEQAKAYAVNGIALKSEALTKAAASPAPPEKMKALVRSYLDLINACMTEEKFEDAARLATAAETLARRADPVAAEPIKALGKDARDMHAEFAKFAAAEKTLATNADDPAANLAVGRYQSFLKGDWEKGLPLLAKGGDAALKKLAESELAKPTEAKDRAALADGWFTASQKSDVRRVQSAQRQRALALYQDALPTLTGLAKVQAEKRIEEIDTIEARFAPGPKLSDAERQALKLERKDSLEKAKAETDRGKKAKLQIKAAQAALKLRDVKNGLAELDKIVEEAGGADSGEISARALIAKGQYFIAQENMADAEVALSTVWKSYRGSYGNSGCEAAKILATHYEKAGNLEKAIPFHEAVIECNGSYGDAAAASCNWLVEYYLKLGNKDKAKEYLNRIIEKHNGSYGNAKKAAEAKLKTLEK